MIKKNKKKFMKISISFFTKILLFFLIIASFIFLISIISTQYYLNFLEKKIEGRFTDSLNVVSQIMDITLRETLDIADSFSWSDNLDIIRESRDPLKDFPHGFNSLGTQVHSYIHSIYFIHKSSKTVIGKNLCMDIDEFFTAYYSDIKFDDIKILSVFKNFDIPDGALFHENKLKDTYVLPLILYDKGKDENFLLLNINYAKLLSFLKNFTLTSNSTMMFVDAGGNIIFNTDYIGIPGNFGYTANKIKNLMLRNEYGLKITIPEKHSINNKKFLDLLKDNNVFRFNLSGEERLFISTESIQSYSKRYYYIASIPYKDIYIQSIPIEKMALFISIISLGFTFILSFLMSKNLYNPIKKIISFLKPDGSFLKGRDEFSYISKSIDSLLHDKEELEESLKITLPMASENYLFKLLNENISNNGDELKKFFESSNISFKYPNFAISIIRMIYGSDFYLQFNKEQQTEIFSQTYNLIKNAFTDKFEINILTISKNEICIIFNLDTKITNEEIMENLKSIIDVYKNKENYVELFTGLSRIHYGLNGLIESYREASEAISMLSLFGQERIREFNPSPVNENQYYYSIIEENQLLNFLLSGLKDETINLIKAIIKKNTNNKQINITRLKDLYMRIYYTCTRAMNQKDISESELMEKNFIDLSKELNKNDSKKISEYLFSLINKIVEYSKNTNKGKFDIGIIIDYINNNFYKDLYLEGMAYDYGITPPHLSRLLKDTLGMSFQQYINNQRIKKAKFILKNTSKGIDEISNECGFNSRFTFIRMFKKLEGITPTEFRSVVDKKIFS